MRKVSLQELRNQVDMHPERVELRVELAQQLFRKDLRDEALEQAVLAADLDLRSLEAIATKGICLMAMGEIADGYEACLRIAQLNPCSNILNEVVDKMGVEMPLIALSELDNDWLEESQSLLQDVGVEQEHITKMLAIAGAAVASDRGEHVTAIEMLRRHLAENPEDLLAKIMVAGSFYDMGQSEIAIKLYRDVLKQDPTNAPAASDLAVALSSLGNHAEAIDWARVALRHCPNLIQAKLNLAGFLFNDAQFEAAKNVFEEVASTSKGEIRAAAMAGLGLYFQTTEAFSTAASMYREAIELDESDPTFRHELAECLQRDGRIDEAKSILHAALERNADDAVALSHLSDLHQQLNEFELSLHYIKQAYQVDPSDEYLINVANAERRIGNFEEAIRIGQSIVDVDPEHSLAVQNLGAYFCAANRLQEAEAFSLRAIELNDERIIARWNLATVYARWKEREQCLYYLKIAIERDPTLSEMAKTDPDLAIYRGDEEFERIVSPQF